LPWRRNLYAVTAASFIGFTGFTLVMPFLPLYFEQLGVTDVGDIALWSGVSLGVTPAITAFMAPLWGRLADRYGRKIMVQRSLVSFVFVMAAMAYVTRPWHVVALRALQGLFAGYGALTLTMAADSAPREETAYAIGSVQTAQRLGPALGPVIGGVVAQAVGLRHAFIVTAGFYLVAAVVVTIAYDERSVLKRAAAERGGRITFRNVLAFENFVLLMAVIFGLQFVDRSFGPILPLFVAALGTNDSSVPLLSGVLFSISAAAGAFGNRLCAILMHRTGPRRVIATASAVAGIGVGGFLLAGRRVRRRHRHRHDRLVHRRKQHHPQWRARHGFWSSDHCLAGGPGGQPNRERTAGRHEHQGGLRCRCAHARRPRHPGVEADDHVPCSHCHRPTDGGGLTL
jgi:MFS family permease